MIDLFILGAMHNWAIWFLKSSKWFLKSNKWWVFHRDLVICGWVKGQITICGQDNSHSSNSIFIFRYIYSYYKQVVHSRKKTFGIFWNSVTFWKDIYISISVNHKLRNFKRFLLAKMGWVELSLNLLLFLVFNTSDILTDIFWNLGSKLISNYWNYKCSNTSIELHNWFGSIVWPASPDPALGRSHN